MTPQPTIPTILQPAPLPTGAQAPSTDPFNSAAAKAWVLADAQYTAYQMNANAKTNYLNYVFPGWLANYQKTGDWTMTPPQPPLTTMVEFADPERWWEVQYLAIGQPLCDIPPYTKIDPPPVPGHVSIAKRIGSTNYWAVGLSDATPDGYETPSPVTAADGVSGLFRRIWSVPAPGGWYLKIG